MKRKPFAILLLYSVCAVSGSLYAIGEKTLTLGGAAGWEAASVRGGIDEVSRVRQYPVLILAAGDNAVSGEAAPLPVDLALSFDEDSPRRYTDSSSHYRVNAAAELQAADRRWARAGSGAALFSGALSSGDPLRVEVNSRDALFASGSRVGDFTLEFWLYPFNLENGERVVSWSSSLRKSGQGAADLADQRIQCVASKNRLVWSFLDFFVSPDGAQSFDIHISGDTPVVPKMWSHHLIRFDSNTGMIEYAVDGSVQAIEYAALSGHEGGEVFTPLAGSSGSFSLGGGFSGIIDEFKIYGACVNKPSLHKYPRKGRVETHPIDLGEGSSEIVTVEARGGRTAAQPAKGSGEYKENGRFRFTDDSEMQFFIRASENPYRWDNSPWRTFIPGSAPTDTVRGRYVQLAVDFYPSADGLDSPYLEDLRITYLPNEPPLPPSVFTAIARDGSVQLRWKNSPDMDTSGYLVYYGTIRGDYFGEDAIMGESPIDAGKQNSLLIDGLQNGVLYYFRVAAYSRHDSGTFHAGEFSREVSARPLEGL